MIQVISVVGALLILISFRLPLINSVDSTATASPTN